AAYRSHGIYSSADGATWTRLPNQPGGLMLSTAACPSASNNLACPLYRAELAVQPQTGDLFTWIVNGSAVDEGIYRSADGGTTWTQIHYFDPTLPVSAGDGITNCGDTGFSNGVTGCGTDQATFNMELMALPTSAGTDVYAGAVNVFRCSITASNPACQNAGSWLNLTHVYGCLTNGEFHPDSHPDQHAIAVVPGQSIVFFGNDGGVYRAMNAASLQGSCGALFDDLNTHLGSLAQLVGFSQDAVSAATLQAGSQDNGTAATTGGVWNTVGSGDGGYNQIDPNGSGNWLNSGNYVDIASCHNGAACNTPTAFQTIVSGANVGDEAAPFFVRYILDPDNTGQMLVGTCRLWRGSATTSWTTVAGTPISPDFYQTFSQPCGTGDDMIRAITAGGPAGQNGASTVIYVGTVNGMVWATRNPGASMSNWSGGPLPGSPAVCQQGRMTCPISDIALDPHDVTGATAYATVMGFLGSGVPHVYRTADYGVSWTGISSGLPDVPANSIAIDPTDPASRTIYVGTDIGVYASTDAGQTWSQYGTNLPTVPVTQLRVFAPSAVLRASTYGRGMWQAALAGTVPDFQLSLAMNSAQAYPGVATNIQGAITPFGGYAQAVTISCDSSAPTVQCSSASVAAGSVQNFSLAVSDANAGDYAFNVIARGADNLTHSLPFTLHVGDFQVSLASGSITAPHSVAENVGVNLSVVGSYAGSVTLGCSGAPPGLTCAFTPASITLPASGGATATVTADSTVAAGAYSILVTASDGGHVKSAPLTVNVTTNPMVLLTATTANLGSVKVGQPLNATLAASSQDGFSGSASLACALQGAGTAACSVTPPSVTVAPGGAPQPVVVAIQTPAATQNATATVTASSLASSSVALNYSVTDFTISATGGAFLTNSSARVPVIITSLAGYAGTLAVGCDSSAIAGSSCSLSPAGPYVLNGAPLSLTATVALNSAASGNYAIKLTASDNAYPALAHAATATVTVQDFSVVPQVTSLSIQAGSAASTVISIAAQNNFSGGVSFSCSGLPSGATCLFTPNVLASIAGGATTVMTISTAKGSVAQPGSVTGGGSSKARGNGGAPVWASLPVFAIFGLAGTSRKRRKKCVAVFAIAVALAAFQVACGGGGKVIGSSTTSSGSAGTPSGSYTVTIIATSGSAQRTATIALTVQ
ncbi:MAG TPA: hypothetical protein VE998_05080, partial [Terriglobales bacterium]|nr:hypothetical protein [Terriglobales bacterium]